MRATKKRYQELRTMRKDLSLDRFSDKDLYAVGFEQGYGNDVRTKDAYMPRREPTYVLAFSAGRRQKAVDIAVQLRDPFSDESRLRAAEARVGAGIIRAEIARRFALSAADGRPLPPWQKLIKYVAPMRESATQTPIYDHARNLLSGHFTPYLRAWRAGSIDSPEVLPVDAMTWPVYRVAVGLLP